MANNRFLLDTHIFLWWLHDDKKLKASVRKCLETTDNRIFVSVASAWEISTKHRIGKLPWKTTVEECFEKSDFEVLNITLSHALALNALPLHHKDPFDRILIAQAQSENMTLITDDTKMKRYSLTLFS